VFLEEGKMAWKARDVMILKQGLISFADQEGANLSALCRQYGIDRKTGRKWLRRYYPVDFHPYCRSIAMPAKNLFQ
jgi:hypothetical protein